MVVLTLAGGKHHHYLLHLLGPWAVLGCLALVRLNHLPIGRQVWAPYRLAAGLSLGAFGMGALWVLRARLGWPAGLAAGLLLGCAAWAAVLGWALWKARGAVVMGAALAAIVAVYWGIFSYALPITDQVWEDTVFLREVRELGRPDTPLLVNADLSSMDIFRILFYLEPGAVPLHNLTYLQDERIRAHEVYVITRARDESALGRLGATQALLQSRRSRRETSPADRLTLFRLRFRGDLPRGPAPARISLMQAMSRQGAPYLVPHPGQN